MQNNYHANYIFIVTAADRPQIPEIDIGFAISATTRNSEETYQQMKNIIKSIIDTYSAEKLRYSLVVYGQTASTKISFTEKTSDASLKIFIDAIPKGVCCS